jgi:hypothetical protein
MANFLINSAAVSVTGTEEKDTFQLTTGASAVTIQALGADDTVELSAISKLSDSVLLAGEGEDTISTLTAGTTLQGVSIGGSLGKDTITFGSTAGTAGVNAVTVNGGQGNDTLEFNADLSGTASALSINGGVGDDFVTVTDTDASFKAALFAGGKGDDELRFNDDGNYVTTTINGGLGEDIIDLSAGVISAAVINGGSNGVEDADTDSADSININADTLNATTVFGNGGDDQIFFSAGVDSKGLSVVGGQGKDAIRFENGSATAATIGGGRGNDTITLSAGVLFGSSIIGGEGEDAITIAGQTTAGNSQNTIQGGGGADTINFTTFGSGTATFSYASNADSTLGTMDEVTLNTNSGVVNALVGVGVGVFGGTAVTVSGQSARVVDGFIDDFASAGIDAGLTAAVEFLNEGLATNQSVAFTLTAGSDTAYLFVQGGDTDLLVEYKGINTTITLTAASVVGNSKLIMDIS